MVRMDTLAAASVALSLFRYSAAFVVVPLASPAPSPRPLTPFFVDLDPRYAANPLQTKWLAKPIRNPFVVPSLSERSLENTSGGDDVRPVPSQTVDVEKRQTIATPTMGPVPPLIQCQTAQIVYGGPNIPKYLGVFVGAAPTDTNVIEFIDDNLGLTSNNVVPWLVDLPAGLQIRFHIGLQNATTIASVSGPYTIQPGNSDNCIAQNTAATAYSKSIFALVASLSSVSAASRASVLSVSSASAASATSSAVSSSGPSGSPLASSPSSASGTSHSNAGSGSNAGAIAGGVVGGLAALALFAGLGWYCARRTGKGSPAVAGGTAGYERPPMQNLAGAESTLGLGAGGAGAANFSQSTPMSEAYPSYAPSSGQVSGAPASTYDQRPPGSAGSWQQNQQGLNTAAAAFGAGAIAAGAAAGQYHQHQSQQQQQNYPQQSPQSHGQEVLQPESSTAANQHAQHQDPRFLGESGRPASLLQQNPEFQTDFAAASAYTTPTSTFAPSSSTQQQAHVVNPDLTGSVIAAGGPAAGDRKLPFGFDPSSSPSGAPSTFSNAGSSSSSSHQPQAGFFALNSSPSGSQRDSEHGGGATFTGSASPGTRPLPAPPTAPSQMGAEDMPPPAYMPDP